MHFSLNWQTEIKLRETKVNLVSQGIWIIEISNYWTVFYKMKIFDCSWEKEFNWINQNIRHWNYPNLSLLSDMNI